MGEIMWCCKCRAKKDTRDNTTEIFNTSRGEKKAIRGFCIDCGTKTIKFVRMDWGDEMNLNDFAREVTLEEGKKREVSIAQVKEILRITLILLSDYDNEEILSTVNRYEGKTL